MNDDDEPPPPAAPRGPTAGETYAQLADFRIIDAIEARVNRRITREWSMETSAAAHPPRLHIEPEDWGAGQLLEVRERDGFAPQLYADLHELTPQAILRDLFRPVHVSRWVERELRAEELDPGARRSWSEVRAAQRRDPLPRVVSLVRDVVAEQHRRRALMAERWQPAKPDDAPRVAVSLEDAE